MKRRALLSGLFALGATIAFSDPAHARGRYRLRSRFRGLSRGTRRLTRRSGLGSTRRFQNVSYAGSTSRRTVRSRVMGEIPANQVGRASQVRRASLSNQYAETRSDASGRLTEQQVYRFREKYASGQSREAMRSALGEPAEHTMFKDRWRIKRTDIYGKPAEDSWFEADYGLSAPIKGSKATTVKPPIAHW